MTQTVRVGHMQAKILVEITKVVRVGHAGQDPRRNHQSSPCRTYAGQDPRRNHQSSSCQGNTMKSRFINVHIYFNKVSILVHIIILLYYYTNKPAVYTT